MKNQFYNAIDLHVSTKDEDKVFGKGSAAEECERVFKNELSGVLLALSATTITQESKQTFINEMIQKYGI